VDPLAEYTEDVTPYHYCLNNPIANVDPTGMWTEAANGYTTNDPREIIDFFQRFSGQQNPNKQDPEKKKEEEKKKKEEERKAAYEKEKKEYEEETGKPYRGLSVEDEEYITQMVMGSPGRLINVGRTVVGAVKTYRALSQLKKLNKLSDDIINWLGKDAKAILNKDGDLVIRSKNNTKRIRFDINNPSPHNNVHSHVEEYINGKWVKSGPLYPKGVPTN
jgi:hypothetical protein